MKLRMTSATFKDGFTKKHDHLIGREGYVFNDQIVNSQCLILVYTTEELIGKALRTSMVIDYRITESEVWVETLNSIYKFDVIEA